MKVGTVVNISIHFEIAYNYKRRVYHHWQNLLQTCSLQKKKQKQKQKNPEFLSVRNLIGLFVHVSTYF